MRIDLAALLNPATSSGTARWVALGVAAYDMAARGANPWNVTTLLALGAMVEALRFLPGGPGAGPGPNAPAIATP